MAFMISYLELALIYPSHKKKKNKGIRKQGGLSEAVVNPWSPEFFKDIMEGPLPCTVGRLSEILEITFHPRLL